MINCMDRYRCVRGKQRSSAEELKIYQQSRVVESENVIKSQMFDSSGKKAHLNRWVGVISCQGKHECC